MKKTTMLIVLLIVAFTTASKAQSTYPIQDTVSAVAPHIPAITRYSGSGDCWHGLDYNYTTGCRDSVASWMATYPWEVTAFQTSIGNYLSSTSLSSLSSGEAEVYKDLRAAHTMVIDR